MLHARTYTRLAAVHHPRNVRAGTVRAHSLTGHLSRVGRLLPNQCLLAGWRTRCRRGPLALARARGLTTRILVVHVCNHHHRAVRQPEVFVHAYVQLYAEVPLLALAGPLHLHNVARHLPSGHRPAAAWRPLQTALGQAGVFQIYGETSAAIILKIYVVVCLRG